MSGLKIQLPTTFSDLTLPIVKDDPALTNGSLWLLDAANEPVGQIFPAGGGNGFMTNIAWAQAAAVLGAGSKSSLQSTFVRTVLGSTEGKFERTPKLGLHGIFSQAGNLGASHGATLEMADPIKQWIFDHPSHGYYWSVWYRNTRLGTNPSTNGGLNWHMFKLSRKGVNWNTAFLMIYYAAQWFISSATGGNEIIGIPQNRYGGGQPLTTSGYQALGVASSARVSSGIIGGQASPYYGSGSANVTPPTNIADMTAGVILGAAEAVNDVSQAMRNQLPSYVLYRTYLEDLTVSGRSYATVDAIDATAYASAFGAGGRYFGDTIPTDPATIP